MNIPKLTNPEKYTGLYVVDFGDNASTGFTAEEVAELLDSEKFADAKVYKIYKAHPDGRLELRAMTNKTFQLEIGMFFYAPDQLSAQTDYNRLITIAVTNAPPSRAKVHLSKYDDDSYVTALIFPAEYNDEFSRWLLDNDYKTAGEVIGGLSAVNDYYSQAPRILKRHQLIGQSQWNSRTGDQLLVSTRIAVQR